MSDITFILKKADMQMLDAIIAFWGDDAKAYEENSLNATEVLTVIVIPLTALTIQVIDFIKTHFADEKGKARKIEVSNSRISMEGYTKDEVIEILKVIKGES